MNKPKARGTAAETAVLRHARANGFPWAERLALTGAADCGDISLLPGRLVILEVKAHATAATGQPGEALLRTWLDQTETERSNAGADHAVLVVKRKGTTDPSKWWTWLDPSTLYALIGSAAPPPFTSAACLPLGDVLLLLRAAGYGTPLVEGVA